MSEKKPLYVVKYVLARGVFVTDEYSVSGWDDCMFLHGDKLEACDASFDRAKAMGMASAIVERHLNEVANEYDRLRALQTKLKKEIDALWTPQNGEFER